MIKKLLLLTTVVFLLQTTLLSQKDTIPNRITRIEVGYAAGVSGDTYFYVANQGLGLSVAHGKRWKDLSLLGGVGYEAYDDVDFIPLFAELSKPMGKNKKTNFRFRMGYAFGIAEDAVKNPEYDFYGGVFMQSGVGFPLVQQQKFKLKIWLDYKYQHGQFQFRPFEAGKEIITDLHYHFGSIKVGFEF